MTDFDDILQTEKDVTADIERTKTDVANQLTEAKAENEAEVEAEKTKLAEAEAAALAAHAETVQVSVDAIEADADKSIVTIKQNFANARTAVVSEVITSLTK